MTGEQLITILLYIFIFAILDSLVVAINVPRYQYKKDIINYHDAKLIMFATMWVRVI